MNPRKFSLRSLLGWIVKKRPVSVISLSSNKHGCTAARDRVRSGIEPLEGRIAPAVLLNGHTLFYNDIDGDNVTVTFSKDIFDMTAVTLPAALQAVFKFSAGKAHIGASNGTDDVAQQLQLIDLSAVPTKLVHGLQQSVVGGVSFSVISVANPGTAGDGFAAIGAIKAGNNALGSVLIDGDLGQIDAGVGTAKVGLGVLIVDSIGKFGTTTQGTTPTPDLNSEIKGRLGRLVVNEDVKGFIHLLDATNASTITQRGTIGSIVIGGSLIGNATVAATSDNSGRIFAYDIGNVSIGTDSTEGIFGGGGKKAGTIEALHALGNVTISGNVEGGAAIDAGAIISGGTTGVVKIGGDLKGGAGLRSGVVGGTGNTASVTIGSTAVPHSIIGGSGESSGFIIANNLGGVHIYGNITGGTNFHSGAVFANGSIGSVIVDGNVTGGSNTNTSSGSIEALRALGSVLIGGDLAGGDGAATGTVVAGMSLGKITVNGDVIGGKGANSGVISGGQNPVSTVKMLGNVTIGGALIGGEGAGSGALVSGGTIAAVRIGTSLTTGSAIQGGIGALSGTVFAHGGIASVTVLRTVAGGSGAGSASIQAEGTIGFVSITGNLTGGTGVESATIFSHENATAARPIAGNIGTISITGSLIGGAERSGLIEADGALGRATIGAISGGSGAFSGSIITGAGFLWPGVTGSIAVNGLIEAGLGTHTASIQVGGRLASLTAGGIRGSEINVGQDLGTLRVNGDVFDSTITARGQAVHALTTDVAIGSITIAGDILNSKILAGYDLAGGAVNADAQIGAVRVIGNWTSSVLAAGVIDGGDDLFGTLDDIPIPVANSARIVAQIASIVIDGNVVGTATGGDHFGFISERIGAFRSHGVALPLNAAGGQSFEVGTDGDTTVRELLIRR